MELILDLVLLYWKQIIVIYLLVVLLILIRHFLLSINSMVHSLKRIEENTTTIAGRLHQINETYETLHKDLKSIEQSLKERIIWPPREP
jgi:Tfp pilus assembly protein PilO